MNAIADSVLGHPGLAVAALLGAGLGVLWLARRVRRIASLAVLCLIAAAVLPGPRSAGLAAVDTGSWDRGLTCLSAAAKQPGIWRSAIDADELSDCRAEAPRAIPARHRDTPRRARERAHSGT